MIKRSLKVFTASILLVLAGKANAAEGCYLGLSIITYHLYDINTKTDYRLLEKLYLKGEVKKQLVDTSHQIQLGCQITNSLGVELGYIPTVSFSSTTLARPDTSFLPDGWEGLAEKVTDRIPTAKVTRYAEGSAVSASLLWYFYGEQSDGFRLFTRVMLVKARAHGQGDLSFPCSYKGKKGECLVGARVTSDQWTNGWAVAPNVGATFRITNNLEGVVEIPYYGPKFYGVALGLRASFW